MITDDEKAFLLRTAGFLILGMILGAFLASLCQAAQIKACWDATSLTDPTATVQVLGAGVVIGEGPQDNACVFVPLTATFPRGADVPIVVAAKNAFGEVGPASNAVTFRAPTVPGQLKNVTVSGVAGP